MATPTISRRDVLAFRFRQQQLDAEPGSQPTSEGVALLDYGVQDTGPDGAAWALAVRGAPPAVQHDLAIAWTLRGAPHAYRRADLGAVAVATAPFSEADTAKRIYDAAKPLRDAGIPVLNALRLVASHLRTIVAKPTIKGDASEALTALVDAPYLRFCRPCGATHVYEMPFRLAALQAGLELEPGTSPPVLRRIRGLRPRPYQRLASNAAALHDVIRNHLRFYGPARVRDVAAFLDAPVRDIRAHWPIDVVEVIVADVPSEPRFVLEEHLEPLMADGGDGRRVLRLVAPFDPYLQLRDRELLVPDEAARKGLWPVLGRPGAILADAEVVGTWRPRASGRKLTVRIQPWGPLDDRDRRAVREQAERPAAHRDAVLAGIAEE
jgi:hypothetical protein